MVQGIREIVNRNPFVSLGAGAAVFLLGVVLILVRALGAGPGAPLQTKVWYTTDDGMTWFADGVKKVPPYMHYGKPAVRAYVVTWDGGKTKVVSHLERYTEHAKQKLLEPTGGDRRKEGERNAAVLFGTQVKRPGEPESAWVTAASPEGMRVKSGPRRDGGEENIEAVLP